MAIRIITLLGLSFELISLIIASSLCISSSFVSYCYCCQEAADNNCVYRNEVHHSVSEQTQILSDVASDPTLPRTKAVRCAKCQHGEAVFFQVYLSSKNAFIFFFKNFLSSFSFAYATCRPPYLHLFCF